MALSFASGTMPLASWAGDIAVFAGAGRTIRTWPMSQRKERALLEFLTVEPEDLLRRRGLVNVISLHQRWDQMLVLSKTKDNIRLRNLGEIFLKIWTASHSS